MIALNIIKPSNIQIFNNNYVDKLNGYKDFFLIQEYNCLFTNWQACGNILNMVVAYLDKFEYDLFGGQKHFIGLNLGYKTKKVQHFFFHSTQHCAKHIKWIFETISLTQFSLCFKCE